LHKNPLRILSWEANAERDICEIVSYSLDDRESFVHTLINIMLFSDFRNMGSHGKFIILPQYVRIVGI
jgi:hypothetical protein